MVCSKKSNLLLKPLNCKSGQKFDGICILVIG
uniref:Uncharacterized protein n=1 Tax=Rhizophora mucronata TaxID=61149 RepID=A0A2P2NAP7_RHIMU